jgi:hypothetical protein
MEGDMAVSAVGFDVFHAEFLEDLVFRVEKVALKTKYREELVFLGQIIDLAAGSQRTMVGASDTPGT